jgi:intracellular sulfur oxidation DsrE/DsrF family protein
MIDHSSIEENGRRKFLGNLAAAGATSLGLAALATSIPVFAEGGPDPDQWFNQVKGKHRVVFDCPRPHELFPFVWPRVFLMTNAATGSTEKDCGVVVVLRHTAIPYAFEDKVWAKYKFGEAFGADDPKTKKASDRNPFWKPADGDYKIPGVGPVKIGINELQESGVMFCVCNAAITVNANRMAGGLNMTPDDLKNDWLSGLLPGVQVVPSGVWALGRAQEHGCGYIFAG